MAHNYHPKYVERFESNVMPVPESGCWLWDGPNNGRSSDRRYGRVWLSRLTFVPAHRFSYEIHRGAIGEGLHVCHKCDTPLCVNPDHLFLGTHQDNMADLQRKGRNRGRRVNAVLSEAKVQEIRSLLVANRLSQWAIARMFNVSQTTISNIKVGKKWGAVQ